MRNASAGGRRNSRKVPLSGCSHHGIFPAVAPMRPCLRSVLLILSKPSGGVAAARPQLASGQSGRPTRAQCWRVRVEEHAIIDTPELLPKPAACKRNPMPVRLDTQTACGRRRGRAGDAAERDHGRARDRLHLQLDPPQLEPAPWLKGSHRDPSSWQIRSRTLVRPLTQMRNKLKQNSLTRTP